MFESLEFFSADYASARAKFRRAARQAGGEVSQYTHPVAVGAQGEELSMDVGLFGERSAERYILLISGTHGLEGFAGSALQVAWLSELRDGGVPPNLGVLMVHGLNPFGFSHGSRTTRNGIDLNRNFIDHAKPLPANPGYEEIHPFLVPEHWRAADLARSSEALARYAALHCEDALFNALARGQYSRPDGIFYGGREREWENETLERIVLDHLGIAGKVAVIDWHTGIGNYGQPFFLVFNPEGSAEFLQAGQWWGHDQVGSARPHGRATPQYQGLVVRGVESFLPGRSVVTAVVEFGTRGAEAGSIAIRQDQWLRLHGAEVEPETRERLKSDVLDSLNPVSYLWRDLVWKHGMEVLHAAVCGVSAW